MADFPGYIIKNAANACDVVPNFSRNARAGMSGRAGIPPREWRFFICFCAMRGGGPFRHEPARRSCGANPSFSQQYGILQTRGGTTADKGTCCSSCYPVRLMSWG